MDTIYLDRDMAHVILGAFQVAEHEAMTSLVSVNCGEAGIHGRPEGRDYAAAELRVLKAINNLYPDVAKQYFDVNKQLEGK
ncbi:hypothetical protein [Nitrospira sp. BLG_2]|uniref:hypothetical protein n=1 Tax=Nitrospira sp. BLG_2 TaxID=3397507 RepID=UPI003B9C3EA3